MKQLGLGLNLSTKRTRKRGFLTTGTGSAPSTGAIMPRCIQRHCAHVLFPWRWTPRGRLGWITPVSHHQFHHARIRGNYGL